MIIFQDNGTRMAYTKIGDSGPVFIWAHGWGQSHISLLPLARSLSGIGQHYLIDFPGFGDSPKPADDWNVESYAGFIQIFIEKTCSEKVIWVGHSFGCRVGLRLAAKNNNIVDKLFLIAGHGVKAKRLLWKNVYLFMKVRFFKFMKLFVKGEAALDKLRAKFGSSDYKTAGAMRSIFMNVIRDDVSGILKDITTPTYLFYGSEDLETPVEIGQRIADAISGAELTIMENMNHYTVLTDGQHQIVAAIKKVSI